MNSEKVKEIKECLKEFKDDRIGYYTNGIDRLMLTKEDVLTYINELESENNLLAGKKINEMTTCIVNNKKLKDRIAELEKENENKTDTITDLINKQEFYEKEKLKQFASKVKECKEIKELVEFGYIVSYVDLCKEIDETLKEFIE